MTAEEDVEQIAPYVCSMCGHTFMVPVEPHLSKCPRCGACVECV